MSETTTTSIHPLHLECEMCQGGGGPLVMLASGGAPIFCSHGSPWKPMPDASGRAINAEQTALEMASMAAETLAKLRAALARTSALGRRLAEYEKGGEVSPKEILRRARVLADRAPGARGSAGKAICPVCGNRRGRFALVSHLRRCHAAELKAMNEDVFK